MSSRREEERNEKIIRGLMKLPPNRRCINCNSLVPQYVCTNFWTFVCTTCGGIHREFTHRVKSVSMAKFTTQELEALQNGGNQRAREIYLKEWDAQNLRLPDDSKPDKIREFIKNVYVNKKYVGGKSTDNASGDVQHLSSHEDENRRASSYHSYSQSPPYDFQYEERRYGKRTSALSRKPGSDRGLYEKHFSSFLSPSRPIDRSPNHVIEDRFAIERSNSRASDCSVSSGGDPFKSDIQSPNFQKDNGSVSSETSREFSSEDLNHLRNPNVDLFSMTDDGKMAHPQRTVSFSGSYGVPNNQLPPSKSNDSSASQSSPHMNFNGLDLFDAPFAPQNVTSPAPFISTSSFPEFPSETPMDLFQPFTSNHVAQAEPPTPALFSEIPKQSPSVSFPEKSSDVLVPSNEGWATFDLPQHAIGVDKSATVNFPGDTNSFVNLDQWPSSQGAPSHGPPSTATLPILPSSQDAPHGPPSTATLPIWPSSQNAPSHGPSSSATLPIWPSSQDAPSHGPPSTATLPIWPSSQNAPSHGPSSSATLPIWPSYQDAPSHGPPSTATLPIWPSSQDAPSHGPSSSATLPIWPSSQDAPSHGQPSSATLPIWHNGPQSIEEAVPSVASTQVWNAFEDSNGHLQIESAYRTSKEASEFQDYGIESVSGANITPMPSALSQSNANMPQHDFSGIPVGAHSFTFNHVSTNPFDIPYDPAVGYDDVPNLWDMSSLHEALPNGQMPTSFTPAANQPWFSDDPIGPFCPPGSEGGLEFIAGQGSSRQLMNGPTQEPVASVGGNPFA